MADNINTRAIVYDMLMSVEKENTPSHLILGKMVKLGNIYVNVNHENHSP